MKRLYLRIYLAVLASLAVLALVAGLTVYLLAQDSPPLRAIETAATLASNALPPAGAAHDVQQAALVKAWAGIAADVSLYAADGKRIASIGEPVALPQRLRGGPIHGWGKGGSWLLPLTDGRWLAVHMPQNHPPQAAVYWRYWPCSRWPSGQGRIPWSGGSPAALSACKRASRLWARAP